MSANRDTTRAHFQRNLEDARGSVLKGLAEMRELKVRAAAGEKTLWRHGENLTPVILLARYRGLVQANLRWYRRCRRLYWLAGGTLE